MTQQQQEEVLRLYDIEREAKIYLTDTMSLTDGSTYVRFHHLDGMYSYCTTEVEKHVIHLSASTVITPYKDGYIFVPEEAPTQAP